MILADADADDPVIVVVNGVASEAVGNTSVEQGF